MIVHRLSKSKFSNDLSGKGAELAGGRWNSKGTAILYTSQSRALCTTEIAVHTPLGNIPADYVLITIEIPDNAKIKAVEQKVLPVDWKMFPHPHETQVIGDQFVQDSEFLVLKVPSVVVQGEYNYLINPQHKDFNTIKLLHTEPFEFDERLFIK